MTNGDKIRSMTDEELEAFFLCELDDDVCTPDTSCCPKNENFIPCCNCWKNWLKQEAQKEAFKRLEQMYDFYAHAMDANKNYPLKEDAEAIKVALLVMAQDRSSHITREQVEKMRGEWEIKSDLFNGCTIDYDCVCPVCGKSGTPETNFCEYCGSPMTDEAVGILWKRLEEALKDGN